MKGKFIKVCVLLILAALFVVSCATSEVPEEFDTDYSASSGSASKLGGLELVYEFGVGEDEVTESVLGYSYESIFADIAKARFAQVQKDYDVKININYSYNYDSCRLFQNKSLAGTFMCDMISGISDTWTDTARIGMLNGILTLSDYIDYTDEVKWGNRSLLEVLYYEDDLFGVIPMTWPDLVISSFGHPMVVNEDIISRSGFKDPREYVETATWTWDTFEECLKQYTVEEEGKTKCYGLATHDAYFAEMFMHSNGDRLVAKDSSGKYYYGIMSPSAQKAMQRGWDIYYGETGYTIEKGTRETPADVVDLFIDQRSVLCLTGSGSIYGTDAKIGTSMENFGILSFPVGPDADPNYKYGISENINYAIAFSCLANYPDAAAIVINALYEPLDGYTTYDDIRAYMQRYYFFDERDCATLFDMFLNQQYNYFHWGVRANTVAYLENQSTSVTQIIDRNKDKFNEDFEKYVMPSVRGIEALWGSFY